MGRRRRSSRRLDPLAELLTEPAYQDLIPRLLSEMPWELLEEGVRDDVLYNVEVLDLDIVGELTHVRWPPDLERALVEWLRQVGMGGKARSIPDDHPLKPGMTKKKLQAWAKKNQVDHLLDVPAALLDPNLRYTDARQKSVADVICGKTARRGSWWQLDRFPASQQERLIHRLLIAVEETREGLEAEAAAVWRTQPVEDPKLAAAQRMLLKAREVVRGKTRPRATQVTPVILTDDPPVLQVGTKEHGVTLRLDPPELVVNRLQPPEELAGLDALLDALTAPEQAEFQAQIRGVLAVPQWERHLTALDRLLQAPPLPEDDDKPLLAWKITVGNDGKLGLMPCRCRKKKRGTGYVTRMEEPANLPEVLLADPVDRAVTELLAPWRTAPREVVLEALELLVGHPRVLAPDKGPVGRKGEPIPVRRARFSVSVEVQDGEARPVARMGKLALDADDLRTALSEGNHARGRLAVLAGEGLHIARATLRAVRVAAAWLQRRPTFPTSAHDRLLDAVTSVSSVVPVAVDPGLRGPRLDGDPRPLLLLHWDGEMGLVVDVRIRPVPELPPEVPGEGSSELFVRRVGVRRCVERDLDAEPAVVMTALQPLALPDGARQGRFSWRLESLQAALDVVERLQAHLDAFQVEWQGDVPRVGGGIKASDLRIEVAEGRDWFGLKGAARHADGVVDVEALLRSIDAGHDYVQVAQGTWARIDQALREQLAMVSDGSGSGKAELSLLQAPVIEAMEAAGAEVEIPVRWGEVLQRLREAGTLDAAVPGGLQGTLRDYQLEGFRWMAALAHWAPGACLADDMGLGKTVQSIALLLHRKEEGPALVVAPTSVVFNWERELERFGPSLRVHLYHGSGRDPSLLERLQPGEVLLTSYGVLVRDAEALQKVTFGAAILDEAQAIKNPTTQRAEAAFGLDAGFRLALSGTPVENRVADLWSLFRFVAPGLLGSWGRFREQFAVPIEGRGDAGRRAVLAKLIRPFVLRRAKEQVERELPALTETVMEVTLSEAERALYDAARVRAVQRLVRQDQPNHLQIFKELSTLRQLACHPKLVDAGSQVPSSKLRQVRRLVSDLRENGHRALIFSQFVRHLGLVREALEADGARIRYLDGSTPLSERRREVDAFQSGDGDVFLISLEAGGVGLNLTAANFVIHLDPWWNPAKEDQATDRAHRIGQQRPVTVYRMVSRGTIEQQILALHAEKRELAEALLSGTDRGHRLTPSELVGLLAEAQGEEMDLTAPDTPPDEAEPDAPVGEAADPAAAGPAETPESGPGHAPALDGLDLEVIYARFCDLLADAHASGEIATTATVRSYRGAVRRMLDAAAPHAPSDAETLLAIGADYVERARAGEVKRKSDKVYARPAYRRLQAMLEGGASA